MTNNQPITSMKKLVLVTILHKKYCYTVSIVLLLFYVGIIIEQKENNGISNNNTGVLFELTTLSRHYNYITKLCPLHSHLCTAVHFTLEYYN